MLEPLFIDTGYVIGLVNVTDAHHRRAVALADRYEGYPLVTTDAVLLEVGNALSRVARAEAVEILHQFEESDNVTLVHLNPILFKSAVGLYEQYKDKKLGASGLCVLRGDEGNAVEQGIGIRSALHPGGFSATGLDAAVTLCGLCVSGSKNGRRVPVTMGDDNVPT